MPGIAWGIIVLWGVLTGSSLLGPPKAWSGRDPATRPRYGEPEPVAYRTWTSAPARSAASRACTFTVFALVTRERLTRLRVNGVEQNLDWSWSWTADLPNGTRGGDLRVEFIDPVGGAVLATHLVSENCWEYNGL